MPVNLPFAASSPRDLSDKPRRIPKSVQLACLDMIHQGIDFVAAARANNIKPDTAAAAVLICVASTTLRNPLQVDGGEKISRAFAARANNIKPDTAAAAVLICVASTTLRNPLQVDGGEKISRAFGLLFHARTLAAGIARVGAGTTRTQKKFDLKTFGGPVRRARTTAFGVTGRRS